MARQLEARSWHKKNNRARLPELDANRHQDKRTNIPTEELRDFVADDEATPADDALSRDPSLDPQLVWKGKDEQDRQTLGCRSCRSTSRRRSTPRHHRRPPRHGERRPSPSTQLTLFADFDGDQDFDRKIEFYQHEQNWANRMILGRLAAGDDQPGREGGAQGQGPDDLHRPALRHQVRVELAGEHAKARRQGRQGRRRNPPARADQAFRDTWKLGIHSYLAYLRDRLVVARELLTETGSHLRPDRRRKRHWYER